MEAFSSPTLIGDLLISGSSKPTKEVDIPASRNVNTRIFLPPNFYISGLRQKVVLISDTLAFAWSGNFMQAVDFFETIEPLRYLSEVDPQYVQSLIDAIDENRKNNLSLIGVLASENNSSIFSHRIIEFQNFGPVTSLKCAGSGVAPFSEIVRQHATNIGELNRNAGVDELAHGFDLNLISALSGEEFVSTLCGWPN
jgi:hypothetical protein